MTLPGRGESARLWKVAGRAASDLKRKVREGKTDRFPKKGTRGGMNPAPTSNGIYAILGPRGWVAHVGETGRASGGLRSRLREHLGNGPSVNSSFTFTGLDERGDTLREGWSYATVTVDDPKVRARAEILAAASLLPLHIGDREGKTTRGKGRRK
jgi:hypothetical protein